MTAERKRILIISVSAGNGHVRAADGLEAGVKHWFPQHEARHLDLMTLVPVLYRKAYKDAYIKLVNKHPALWGYIYDKTDQLKAGSALSKLLRAVESRLNKALLGFLRDYAPHAIICTHFMPAQVLRRWKGKGRLEQPLWTVITDFVAHQFWLEPGITGYFTASEEDAWRLRRKGVETESIIASGIPVLPEFIPSGDPAAARDDAVREFGLDGAKKTLLLMGGGAGVGNMLETARELLALDSGFQLVVLAGRNQKLLTALREFSASCQGRLFPLGFTNRVAALLAASDLVITKPGGLTTVECLSMGKPMLVFSPIPGQEEHNADYLLENGAALKAADLNGLIWRVKRLLDAPELLPALAANAAKLGRPYSSRDILTKVLDEAPQN